MVIDSDIANEKVCIENEFILEIYNRCDTHSRIHLLKLLYVASC